MNKDFISYISSSQKKIFPDDVPSKNFEYGTALKNEPFSITLAYKTIETTCLPVSVFVKCDGLDISIYKIGFVPVTHPESVCNGVASENRGAGLYPDMLLKRKTTPELIKKEHFGTIHYENNEKNTLNATCSAMQSVLITFNENGKDVKPGIYDIEIFVCDNSTLEVVGNHKFTLKIIDQNLPETELMYTNWFHYDSLADIHGVELYSEKYYEIFKKYISNATKFRMNTLLIPAFTPPLDTFQGEERTNSGVVKIKRIGKDYQFDFSELERIIKIASDCGITYFEHPHFFTQWGAKHAPNIYADDNGTYKRIFGWETDATGDEYNTFLNAYIPEFLSFAKKIGISEKLFFHISDEPNVQHEESYKKAVELVSNLLKDYKSGDALSSVKYYNKGLVKIPIVQIDNADNFFGKCETFWLYYTGGYYPASADVHKCANRLLSSKPYCTRILGLHLYKYKTSGFLHWGYNFYYDKMCKGIFDPKADACGYKQMPGASYLAYPGINEPIPSLREKYMCEAMDDYRALKALEKFIGYDEVIKLCNSFFSEEVSCFTIPDGEDKMIAFREMINNEIEKRTV